MFGKKCSIIIGLTTFNTEMLQISVPALARIKQKFHLVLHNDNPNVNVKKKHLRKLGYRGRVSIINTDTNVGQLGARLKIVEYVSERKLNPKWITFVDDDDVLTNVTIPNVKDNVFAIIQNAIIVRKRTSDLMRIMQNPNDYEIDSENVIIDRPHIGASGTMIRWEIMHETCKVIRTIMDKINKINSGISWRAPVDAIMWSYLNSYVKYNKPEYIPIYMDSINYISIKMDSCDKKYGRAILPTRKPEETYEKTLARYNALINAALAAAPTGQNS